LPNLEIAKYFGESSADGIQFQFRSVKKDAEKLRSTFASGGNTATALSLGLGTATPSRSKGTPSKPRKTPSAVKAATSILKKEGDSEGDLADEDVDYSDPETPSKRPGRDKVLSGRVMKKSASASASSSFIGGATTRAPSAAAATMAAAAATAAYAQTIDLTASETEVETPVNVESAPLPSYENTPKAASVPSQTHDIMPEQSMHEHHHQPLYHEPDFGESFISGVGTVDDYPGILYGDDNDDAFQSFALDEGEI
jgi:hypothetical protein